MNARNRLPLTFAMAMFIAGSVQAACDVTISSILTSGQAVLKANCGAAVVKAITWTRDPGATTLAGPTSLTPNITGDIFYTTPLLDGTYIYSATGTDSANGALTAGAMAAITTPQPTLIVAPTTGGTVTSSPAGVTACANGSGTCTAGFSTGSTVTLTAAPNVGTHSFSGWSGDCTGTGLVCAVYMSGPRTVSANFGGVPVTGVCGSANTTALPGLTSPPSSNLCDAGTASAVTDPVGSPYNYTWTCTGANSGGNASCSAPKAVAGTCGTMHGGAAQSSTPTTNLCGIGTASTVTATTSPTYEFRWTCAGPNGGAASSQCAVAQQSTPGACGSANGGNTASTPSGAAACSAGTSSTVTVPAAGGDYTWTCQGLAGGAPSGTCTAHQTVAAACGTANNVAVSSAPTTNLCAAGNTASAVTGSGPFDWTCSGVNPVSGPLSCSAPLATGGCGATPGNFSTEDWTNYTSSTAVFIRSIPAGNGIAIRFTPSSTSYPLGVIMSDLGTGAKTYSISSCAGDMTHPVNGQNGSISVNGDSYLDNCNTVSYMRYPGYSSTYLATQTTCWLSPSGGPYYLNVLNASGTASADIQLKNGKLLK